MHVTYTVMLTKQCFLSLHITFSHIHPLPSSLSDSFQEVTATSNHITLTATLNNITEFSGLVL